MAQECGFFNAQLVGEEFDRVYLAEQFAAYFAAFIGNGIYGKSMQKLQVLCQDIPNMSIKVLSGEAFINGWWYRNKDTYNIQIPIADGVLSRIDVIVVRWGNSERDMWLQLITGTPSINPVKPDIRRDADYYDLQLATINVTGGTANIIQAQIQDTRLDNAVCGLVTGVVDQIDTTNLYNQFESYFEYFKENYEADFNQWTIEKKAEYDQVIQTSLQDFNGWFDGIRDKLSEDVAGSLQNQIDAIDSRILDVENVLGDRFSKLVTLTAANWTGDSVPYVQTIVDSDVKEGQEALLVSALSENATLEEQKAYMKAYSIISSGVGIIYNGIIVFKVYKKPVIDIVVGLIEVI